MTSTDLHMKRVQYLVALAEGEYLFSEDSVVCKCSKR